MSTSQLKILVTGATGYIGGSVLSVLVSSQHKLIQECGSITCLIRNESAAKKLKSAYGDRVTPVLFEDIDDTETVAQVASRHDIVVNTLLGYHPASAAALVKGLGKRRRETGRDVYMIHTSGTSNLGDKPLTGKQNAERVFSDETDDIYGYEKASDEIEPYAQRTSELGVIDTGLDHNVKTLVIMSPMIYGGGTGLFHRSSIQIPGYIRATLAVGHGVVIGDGKGIWDHVHITDVARLYELAITNILVGTGAVPFGKTGIIFSEAGRHTWEELAKGIADAAFGLGKVKTQEVGSVGLAEGAKYLAGGDEAIAEVGFASNSLTKGVVARERLGWRPLKTEWDWKANFAEEVKKVIEEENL